MYPEDRRYTKDHEWVKLDGDTARIGITDFAQQELGDIVFVEVPEAGLEVAAGDVLGTIESVKAVSEIFAPIAGTVVRANDALDAAPESVNADPHGEGWYCEMRVARPDELDELMSAGAYAESIAG